MEQVRIRACTRNDIDGVIASEWQWEQEAIAYGDFNPMSREAYIAILERFLAYFLVAESGGQLVGYIHASKETDRILKFYRSHGFTPWRIQFFK
jgi:hypothetical protein